MGDNPMTPVIYTRGLQTSGTWSATSGVYKDAGGFIAFLGGSVRFYTTTNPTTNAIFLSNNPTSTSTTRPTDVRQAIPFNTSNSNNSGRIYGIPPADALAPVLPEARARGRLRVEVDPPRV